MRRFYERWRKGRPIVFGHRGYPLRYPENGLRGLKAALASGADGVECDLRATKDGVVVLLHDPLLDRTTDGKGRLSEWTWQELREVHLLGVDGKPTEERIPSLRELCEALPTDCLYNLELKGADGREEAYLDEVVATIRAFHLEPRVLISSFDLFLLQRFTERAPDIATAWIVSGRIPNLPETARHFGVEALHVESEWVQPEDVAAWRQAGFAWAVWGLWTPSDASVMLGPDAVHVDDLTWFAAERVARM